mmetsp:Transcript_19612/g.63028  ORF Transcript_19612/g.63028 Transcript_19612/m.63028 type:complete len:142 (+) Transcript_19612:314-739(+)
MQRFQAAVPESATVLRESEWVDVDAVDLAVSDVLRLREGDIAPADARVLKASRDFAVTHVALTGEPDVSTAARNDFVPLAARCDRGQAKLVVIAIGDDVLLARKIRSGDWPPPPRRRRRGPPREAAPSVFRRRLQQGFLLT